MSICTSNVTSGFIDLATFFPRIDRGACKVAELLHGLPKEVIELTALIYGAADDPEGAINCQYDSAGGLGDPFKNRMGALMGCVLSPDKAKILLNSIDAAKVTNPTRMQAKGIAARARKCDSVSVCPRLTN